MSKAAANAAPRTLPDRPTPVGNATSRRPAASQSGRSDWRIARSLRVCRYLGGRPPQGSGCPRSLGGLDLILVGEAHREPAHTWNGLPTSFPYAGRVLTTVTPYRSDRVLRNSMHFYTNPVKKERTRTLLWSDGPSWSSNTTATTILTC